MEVEIVVVGSYQTNCYLLKKDGYVLIIDPGDEFSKIQNSIGTDDVLGILVTHRHFDHIGALEECVQKFQAPIFDKNNLKEQIYQIGPFQFEVVFTPGHTNDSITFLFPDEHFLFVGDFIFKDSIGRTDLGGNINVMKKSLHDFTKLKNRVEQDYQIFSGHGESTTLNRELLYNPYLTNIDTNL